MADPATIEQFGSVTGADPTTAQFFLNASRNNLDAAVNAFFEAGGVIPAGARAAPAAASASAASSSSAPTSVASRAGRSRPAPSPPTGGVATLASLGGEGDEDEDESGKNYYAGGEKSGQMIQDPRGRDNERELADEILERARQRVGAMDDEERERFGENQRFTGAGFRLGENNAPPPSRPAVVGRRNVTRTITFYDSGFVVDDGPLRDYEAPANESFLADVYKGVVPKEMEEPGIGDVSINLVDKKGEPYVPTKDRVVPFSGGGQRLGASSAPTAPAPAVSLPATEAANATLVVDEAQPVAVVQVRLSDGTRMRARFNDNHTVGQLRAFVQAARPAVSSFSLATTFPRKELTDDAQSIKDAGLKGAVVVQTLK